MNRSIRKQLEGRLSSDALDFLNSEFQKFEQHLEKIKQLESKIENLTNRLTEKDQMLWNVINRTQGQQSPQGQSFTSYLTHVPTDRSYQDPSMRYPTYFEGRGRYSNDYRSDTSNATRNSSGTTGNTNGGTSSESPSSHHPEIGYRTSGENRHGFDELKPDTTFESSEV